MRLLTGAGMSVPPCCAFFNFPLESLFDCCGASIKEAFNIEDVNATAAIIDETSFLKFASNQGDAAALHAQHLRQELLR